MTPHHQSSLSLNNPGWFTLVGLIAFLLCLFVYSCARTQEEAQRKKEKNEITISKNFRSLYKGMMEILKHIVLIVDSNVNKTNKKKSN